MSYTPTNWKKGDVVTSEKLNNMESGIAGAGQLVVEFSWNYDGADPVLVANKTISEINAFVEENGCTNITGIILFAGETADKGGRVLPLKQYANVGYMPNKCIFQNVSLGTSTIDFGIYEIDENGANFYELHYPINS